MSLFEDLVDELKDEHLLEETVIESTRFENGQQPAIDEKNLPHEVNSFAANAFLNGQTSSTGDFSEKLVNFEDTDSFDNSSKKQISEKEFYRKRAMEEVASLQMVEHVISGVEREQMKLLPQAYDDLTAKKALHVFLQIAGDVKSPEHIQAEFAVMQETENWCSALSYRDKRISIAHLRRFCETTKPGLSSQALIALARFYRNLPFSESVRNKFDLVLTRLFAKEIGGEKRYLVFNRTELAEHLTELYAEWESIQLYSDGESEEKIRETVKTFNEFIDQAEKAQNFDQLIEIDLFTRLRSFKEATHEMFFAPSVAAAAVDCNIRIGNRYVELIEQERDLADAEILQDKYGFLHDQAISDATSKTLQLVELLKEREESAADADEDRSEITNVRQENETVPQKPKNTTPFFSFSQVNRPLLFLTIIVCLLCGGLYVWANYVTDEIKAPATVQKVDLENSPHKNILQSARITSDTYYGILLPDWENLAQDKKEELLKALYQEGKANAYHKVVLIDKEGKNVAFASEQKMEILH